MNTLNTNKQFKSSLNVDIDTIVSDAIDVAIKSIQDALGEKAGDYASHYFSDEQASGLNIIRSHLASYVLAQQVFQKIEERKCQ